MYTYVPTFLPCVSSGYGQWNTGAQPHGSNAILVLIARIRALKLCVQCLELAKSLIGVLRTCMQTDKLGRISYQCRPEPKAIE